MKTTGSDSLGNGSLSQPWLTPVFGAAHLGDGDTLYIHTGTYQINTSSSPIKSAAIAPSANNTTIKAFPGDTVSLIGNSGAAPTNGVIGNTNGKNGGNRSNLIIDGFIIQGIVVMESGKGVVVKNCDISVGGDNWSGIGQGEVIWFENCDECQIINNKLHDNTVQSNIVNNSLVLAYTGLDLLIEHNEIYNSAGVGITIKDTVVNTTIRYNFIHNNNYSGIWTANQGNPYKSYSHPQNIDIYQNIISTNNKLNDPGKANEHGGITFVVQTENINIYNNTFFNNIKSDFTKWTGSSMPASFFNNISYNPEKYFLNWPYKGATLTFTYLDYNNYYTKATPQWKHPNYERTGTLIYSPLSVWKAKAQELLPGSETNSIDTDPGFINASGLFNTPTDFKRFKYAMNGRGGSHSKVMGAYITDNEQIGPILLSRP